MQIAYETLLQHPTVNTEAYAVRDGPKGRTHPFIVTLGGDHTIVCSLALHSRALVDSPFA